MDATSSRRARRILLALLALCTVLALCAGAIGLLIATRDGSGASRVSAQASWDFPIDDKRALVDWADDVFVGRVVAETGHSLIPVDGWTPGQEGDGAVDPRHPYTLFEVEVGESLKGPLNGLVTIRQDTGFDSRGVLHTMDDDPLLVVGGTYLFVTKGPDADAARNPLQPAPECARVVNKYGDIPIDGLDARRRLVSEFRAAIGEQLPPPSL